MANREFLPEEIRDLPYPWCLTSASRIWEALSSVTLTDAFVETSLNVMDRCLTILPSLVNIVEQKRIPEYADYWPNYCHRIQWDIPSLTDARLSVFEEKLELWKDLRISVEELVESWLSKVVPRIASISTQWVETTIQNYYFEEKYFRLKYLDIVKKHWRSVDDPTKCGFAYSLSRVAGNDALPFLNEILAGDEVDYVKEAAEYSIKVLLEPEEENGTTE